MKMYDAGLIVLVIVITTCVVAGTLSGIFWYKDNPIEETAEAIIKQETGVDIDLTPSTPEHSKPKTTTT